MSTVLPSRAQIALALIMLRSCSPGVSIEEYIHDLRSTVVRRSRKATIESQHYIDGTRFWKLAYERMEAENNSLLDKIFVLENNNSKSHSPTHAAPTAVKRKAEANATTRANMQTKRRNLGSDTPSEAATVDLDFDFASKPIGHRLLLRSFYDLQSSADTCKQDASALCRSIKTAAYNAGQAFDTVIRNRALLSKTSPQTPVFADLCSACMKVWISILHNVRRLEQLNPLLCSDCLPYIAILVQKFLGLIQQHCLDEADSVIKSKKKTKTKPMKNSQMPQLSLMNEANTFCKGLSKLLYQMFIALDLNVAAHCSILETSICSLLDHIGSSMSLLVFAKADLPIEKQQGILPPCGLLDVAHIDSETAILTTQLAAPYLVRVLQHVMVIVDRMSSTQRSQLLRLDKTGEGDSATTTMLDKMKEMLQNTLLRGVYGDDDATFKHALDRATAVDTVDMEKVLASVGKQTDVSEWFIGQVWEHLGWDVLAA